MAFLSWGKSCPTATPAVKKWQCMELRVRAVDLGSFGASGSFLGLCSSCGLYKSGQADRGANYGLAQDCRVCLKLGVCK